MQNIKNDRLKELAWSRIAEAVVNRHFLQLQKNFFWLRRLEKESEIVYNSQ